MPRHRDERDRVLGPTWIPSKSYWRVVILTPGAATPKERKTTRYYREQDEAEDSALDARKLIERNEHLSLEEVIDAFDKYLDENGAGEIYRKETRRRLRLFFPDLEMSLGRVDSEKAKAYYKVFRKRQKGAGTISVSYHRGALINARSLFSWCIEQGMVTANPFEAVKGMGKRNSGKKQHTGDESIAFYSYCFPRAQAGDAAALGVLLAWSMALRSGDLYRRLVRDVDFGGTALRVSNGKNEKSNRPRKIPEVLRPLVRQLVGERGPEEPLFKTPYTKTGHHTRRWLEEAMGRFCKAAGVPYVCPHALKGNAGSILAESGAAAEMIIEHLSHEEGKTTRRHYVDPGAMDQVQAERAFAVIAGGKR